MTTPSKANRTSGAGFLGIAEPSSAVQHLYDGDLEGLGYVMNASKLWAHQPDTHDALFEVVKYLQTNPEIDLVFSDEDKITEEGLAEWRHRLKQTSLSGRLRSLFGSAVPTT